VFSFDFEGRGYNQAPSGERASNQIFNGITDRSLFGIGAKTIRSFSGSNEVHSEVKESNEQKSNPEFLARLKRLFGQDLLRFTALIQTAFINPRIQASSADRASIKYVFVYPSNRIREQQAGAGSPNDRTAAPN
jgi:hypothetical protein